MRWEVGVIVDPNYDPSAIGSLTSDMPIWIVDTPANRAFAEKLRKASEEVWLPQPICTTFMVNDPTSREENCLGVLNTVDQHHPSLAKLHLVGVNVSEHLRLELSKLDFLPFEPLKSGTIFVRPIESMRDVPHLHLDAMYWKRADDVYKDLFTVLGSPGWHGTDFNALDDSIAGGSINAVEVPYVLSILNMKSANPEVKSFVSDLIDLIFALQKSGCPISIQVES